MAEARDGEAGSVPRPDDRSEPGDSTKNEAVTALEAELADTKDKLLRSFAEQQNIRRLMQRERDEAVKFAASRLAEDLLETLDNLRRAVESASASPSGEAEMTRLVSGVEATERNLLAVLARHGVQRIDPLGELFDPHRHQAVFQQPDSAEEGRIIEVLQPGYMLHDRLLRPAMVGVAASPTTP
jgi:molecular chaperone GrpE